MSSTSKPHSGPNSRAVLSETTTKKMFQNTYTYFKFRWLPLVRWFFTRPWNCWVLRLPACTRFPPFPVDGRAGPLLYWSDITKHWSQCIDPLMNKYLGDREWQQSHLTFCILGIDLGVQSICNFFSLNSELIPTRIGKNKHHRDYEILEYQ